MAGAIATRHLRRRRPKEDVMEAGYACERLSAKAERTAAKKASLIVVVLPDATHRGASGGVDSVNQRVEDDCAGGIVRFSLGSDGH
jgi:hypothetical protein